MINQSVLMFLKLLRESDPYITGHFSQGSCFKLYKMLKRLYPGAEPYKCGFHNGTLHQDVFQHVVTKIGGVLYDINGVFDPGYMSL